MIRFHAFNLLSVLFTQSAHILPVSLHCLTTTVEKSPINHIISSTKAPFATLDCLPVLC
eukprot:m.104582 g.104582  ORF g.104582 m.104582 type:complete len:59 (+) comp15253_c0_seq6:2013-2189(+)